MILLLNELKTFVSKNTYMIQDICIFLTSLIGLGANRCIVLLYKKNHKDKPELIEILMKLSNYVIDQIIESHLTLKDYNVDEYNLVLNTINDLRNNKFNMSQISENNLPESNYGTLCIMINKLIININNSNETNWLEFACELGRLAYYIVEYHYILKPNLLKLYKNNMKIIFNSITMLLNKYAMDCLHIEFQLLYQYNLLSSRFVELYYRICGEFELHGTYPFDDYIHILENNRIHICDSIRHRPELSKEFFKKFEEESIIMSASVESRNNRHNQSEIIKKQLAKFESMGDSDIITHDIIRTLKLQLISETMQGLQLEIGFIDFNLYNYMNKVILDTTEIINSMTIDDFKFTIDVLNKPVERYKNFDNIISYIDKWIRAHINYLNKQSYGTLHSIHKKQTSKFMFNYLHFMLLLVNKMPIDITKVGHITPHKYVIYLNWIDNYCSTYSLKSKNYKQESCNDHNKIFEELMADAEAEYKSNEIICSNEANENLNNIQNIIEDYIADEIFNTINVPLEEDPLKNNKIKEKYLYASKIIKSDIITAEKIYKEIISEAVDHPIIIVDCLAELVTCYMKMSKINGDLDYIYNAISYAENAVDYYKEFLAPMLESNILAKSEVDQIYLRSQLVYFQLQHSREWLSQLLDSKKNKMAKIKAIKAKLELGRLEAMHRLQDKWYNNTNKKSCNKYKLLRDKINLELVKNIDEFEKIQKIDIKYQLVYDKINQLYLTDSSENWKNNIINMSKALIVI